MPLGVPAAGIEPIEPGCVTAPGVVVVVLLLLLLLLLQAARAVRVATARASPPMRFFPDLVIAPPSPRCSRHWSVLGSSACRPSLSQFAGDPLRTVAGSLGRNPPETGTARLPGTSEPDPSLPTTSRPVSYRCYELAEA